MADTHCVNNKTGEAPRNGPVCGGRDCEPSGSTLALPHGEEPLGSALPHGESSNASDTQDATTGYKMERKMENNSNPNTYIATLGSTQVPQPGHSKLPPESWHEKGGAEEALSERLSYWLGEGRDLFQMDMFAQAIGPFEEVEREAEMLQVMRRGDEGGHGGRDAMKLVLWEAQHHMALCYSKLGLVGNTLAIRERMLAAGAEGLATDLMAAKGGKDVKGCKDGKDGKDLGAQYQGMHSRALKEFYEVLKGNPRYHSMVTDMAVTDVEGRDKGGGEAGHKERDEREILRSVCVMEREMLRIDHLGRQE
ncbi:unnamed protein product [Discosporangium mesarthrocarpum]